MRRIFIVFLLTALIFTITGCRPREGEAAVGLSGGASSDKDRSQDIQVTAVSHASKSNENKIPDGNQTGRVKASASPMNKKVLENTNEPSKPISKNPQNQGTKPTLSPGTLMEKKTTPRPKGPEDPIDNDLGVIAKSDNMVSNTEKEKILKDLEKEMDDLFENIDKTTEINETDLEF